MKRHRSQARVAVGACALLALLGLGLLAFAGDVGLSRSPAGPTSALTGPLMAAAGVPGSLYIKFDGVDGEAVDKDHKAWSNALAFSQGQSLPTSRSAAGAAAGRPVFENLVVTKELDKASPKLAEAVCRGKVFPKVEIHLTRSFGGMNQTYYKYELKNAVISSYQISGASQTVPVDEIALSFEEIKVTYTEYDVSGKAKANVEYTWRVS